MSKKHYTLIGLLLLAFLILGLGTSSSQHGEAERQLQAKLYLIAKYNPGTCFGIPTGISDSERADVIRMNSDLIRRLGLAKRPDDAYHLVQKLHAILLTKDTASSYSFKITSGLCCKVETLTGILKPSPSGFTDKVTTQKSETTPC